MVEPASELEVLRAENKLLRLLLRDAELYGQAFEYRPPNGERMVLRPLDVTVHIKHDAVTMYEAALKVVATAERWRDGHDSGNAVPGSLARALREAVDERRNRAQ